MQSISNDPEEWRPVPGWEGIYEVSNHGQVRSLARTITYKDGRRREVPTAIMKASQNTNGYRRVALAKENGYQYRYVHSLVAEVFIGPRGKGVEVCHGDGDKTNNHLSNLRYGTRGENMLDTVKHGTNVNAGKEVCPRGHRLESPNLVRFDLLQGRRACLACARTHSYTHYHVHRKPDFKEISDSYYGQIVGKK